MPYVLHFFWKRLVRNKKDHIIHTYISVWSPNSNRRQGITKLVVFIYLVSRPIQFLPEIIRPDSVLMTLGMGDVLTCLLAHLCSQLGLQLPRPQLVVPTSSPISISLCLRTLLHQGCDPQIRWSRPFCVQCHCSCQCRPLSGQAHNSFSCCSFPPTVTIFMIWWQNLVQFSLLLDHPITLLWLHWQVNRLWIFGSYSSSFHFSE